MIISESRYALIAFLVANLLIFSCGIRNIHTINNTTSSQRATQSVTIRTDTLTLFHKARNRPIPLALYVSDAAPAKKVKQKVAIISHGYGGKNTAYSFIARNLVAQGYFVASIQHELPGDEPLPTTGYPYEVRMPNWKRGVQNILFVVQELQKRSPELDFDHLVLIGHSNGGDMSMLFAHTYPALVHRVISLDNRRMPIPRTWQPRILSIRSSDQPADAGVLPTPEEQQRFGITIIKLNNTIHNDMWDGATESQIQEMNAIISDFLRR